MNSPQTVLLSTPTIEHLSLYLVVLALAISQLLLWTSHLYLKYQVIPHCLSQ